MATISEEEQTKINKKIYKKIMASENKFKPGDIITNFKDKPSYYCWPTKEWIKHLGLTWKVISIDSKRNYNLIRLDTLTKAIILDKNTKEELKETIRKENIEFWDTYKIWDENDVKAIYKKGLDELDKEKKEEERIKAYNYALLMQLLPKIKKHLIRYKSIEKTEKKFYNNGITMDDIWDIIDENDLKLAEDYLYVKNILFWIDDMIFEKFENITKDIIKSNKKENELAKSVLSNQYLYMKISDFFRKSKKGQKVF